MTLRRHTNAGANATKTPILAGAPNERHCMKCNCWRPQKGGRLLPGTKLWICGLDHKAKAAADAAKLAGTPDTTDTMNKEAA